MDTRDRLGLRCVPVDVILARMFDSAVAVTIELVHRVLSGALARTGRFPVVGGSDRARGAAPVVCSPYASRHVIMICMVPWYRYSFA